MANKVCAVSISPAIDKTLYVDDFTINEVNRVDSFCDAPGSKGVNVAINLAQCGFSCTCAGFIGKRGTHFIKSALQKHNVVCDFVPVPYDVRTNLKIVDLKNKTYTDINLKGGTPSDEAILLLKEKIRNLSLENEFIALSGNISSKKHQNLYNELIHIINSEKCRVTVDCCGEALRLAAAAKPFAIKPNLSEFNEAFNLNCTTAADIKNAALRLCEDGIKNVLVTLDKNGAVAVCGKGAYFIHNCEVPVLNTVGAGDAFLSGFIYASALDMPHVLRLKHAASFAQAAVSSLPASEKTAADFAGHVCDITVEEI